MKKLGINLPHDLATPLLGIYPEKIIIKNNTWTPMLMAALFTVARTGKQPRRPLTDEWIRKTCYIHTMGCSVQVSSVAQSCPTLQPHESQHARPPCHHHLPEFTQTLVHRVGDAIWPSHPLSSPFPPAPNPS